MARKFFCILLNILLLCTSVPAAAGWLIHIEPDQNSITFSLKATLHTVHGTAAIEASTLQFDPVTGVIFGDIAVSTASTATGNTKRDKKMHTKVLRSSDYPRLTLRPHHIDGEVSSSGSSRVVLRAEIELQGKDHAIEIPLEIEIVAGRFTATGEFVVPYVEWGLKDPSTFVLRVAKEVPVDVEIEGTIDFGEKER